MSPYNSHVKCPTCYSPRHMSAVNRLLEFVHVYAYMYVGMIKIDNAILMPDPESHSGV
jgi:hypothetical protein